MKQLAAYLDTSLFFLVAGPCVVEDEEMPLTIAAAIHMICRNEGIPFVFKASYRKANRTRADSFTGIGDLTALRVIAEVGKTLDIPVITDVHTPSEAALAAEYADILQIPAFLCRQTDLLQAAAETGRAVNIKKGQFLSAAAMRYAVDKVLNVNPDAFVALTERGSMFGYQDLVVDYRNIPWMQAHGVPVILDATHSLQQPNTAAGVSGGLPMLIDTIGSAGIAAGVDGIFLETHPEPAKAKSDGANMLPLDQLEALVRKWIRIRKSL